MKVLILGAAGRAAKAVISFLPFLGRIERVYLADRNAEALCKMAADLRHLPVSPRYLDAENRRDDNGTQEKELWEAQSPVGLILKRRSLLPKSAHHVDRRPKGTDPSAEEPSKYKSHK